MAFIFNINLICRYNIYSLVHSSRDIFPAFTSHNQKDHLHMNSTQYKMDNFKLLVFSVIQLCLTYSYAMTTKTTNTDIVIAGAGTSGCILAARICALLPNKEIYLIERGLPRNKESEFLIRAPRRVYESWRIRSMTEVYQTEPDNGINKRRMTVLTAGTLGGTSTIGGLQWIVPLSGSVEQWGIENLNTASSKPYYLKAFQTMQFKKPPVPLNYAEDIVKAAVKAGFQNTSNVLNQPGMFVWQNRIAIDKSFRRLDTCEAYVKPALSGLCSQNLKIVQGVTASKLVFEKKGNKLSINGIETLSTSNGIDKHVFNAKSEVILSLGPYGTPKLLQLSGIGSNQTLSSVGIEQELNLPVGENSVARPAVSLVSSYSGVPDEPTNNLSLINSVTELQRFDSGQGGLNAVPITAANGRNGYLGYLNAILVPFTPRPPTITTACYLNSKTKGFIRLRSNNPFTAPTVKLNLLGKSIDVGNLAKCVRKFKDIHMQLPSKFQAKYTNPSDGKITWKWIRNNAYSSGHMVGGCPVGSVLDGNLKVLNTEGLRVIDASSLRAMPLSAGPVSSIEMLAEYMSEVVANSY